MESEQIEAAYAKDLETQASYDHDLEASLEEAYAQDLAEEADR